MIRTVSTALLALAFSTGAAALEVTVKAIESMDDFQRWFQQTPAPRGTFPTLSAIAPGKKVFLPIIVTGFGQATGPLQLVGDMEIVDPTGKTAALRQCCRYSVADRTGIVTAVLGNTVTLELDPGDPQGVYTVRATVTDGIQSAIAEEKLRYGSAGAASRAAPKAAPATPKAPAAPPKAAAAAPKPAAGTPKAAPAAPADSPAARAPRSGGGDLRHCLSLPTPAEIIRCTEKP